MKKMYGSLQNRMMENQREATSNDLYVGMGATELFYTDRKAYEVVKVISNTKVEVRECDRNLNVVEYHETKMTQELKDDINLYLNTEIDPRDKKFNDVTHILCIFLHNGKRFQNKCIKAKVGDVIANNNETLTYKNGCWRAESRSFVLGYKNNYQDPSF